MWETDLVPKLTADDRVMIVAPHPDDEVLAVGGFVQRAVVAGAAVRAVFATDGDNDPWRERWVEGRWRIEPEDRRRWGARRRGEALKSMACLGLGPEAAHFLGFPDQGLTELLMGGDPEVPARLRFALEDFHPTLLLVPAPQDLHPDHNALFVLSELAVDGANHGSSRWTTLCYLTHGRGGGKAGERSRLILTPEERSRKREAILCHASQMAGSRWRFLNYVKETETFSSPPAPREGEANHPIPMASVQSGVLRMELKDRKALGVRRSSTVCVVIESLGKGSFRRKVRLGAEAKGDFDPDPAQQEVPGAPMSWRRRGGLEIAIPIGHLLPARRVFVKLDRRRLFYDEAGWREIPLGDGDSAA